MTIKQLVGALLCALCSAVALAQDSAQSEPVDYGMYNALGMQVNGDYIMRAKARERAVAKAGVPPSSPEAAMIRSGMGAPPELAYEPNDVIYDTDRVPLTDKEIAARLAAEQIIVRSGMDPNSAQADGIRASAANGELQGAEGGEIAGGEDMEEMAKEMAIQEAMMRTGSRPGTSDEVFIRSGAEALSERYKRWRNN